MRRAAALVVGLLACGHAAACEDIGAHDPIEIESMARVQGRLFLDLNGNGQLDATDQRVNGWGVRLLGANRAVVSTATSDSAGVFAFEVGTGRVLVDVDRARLGDSLQVFGLAVGRELTLARGDTVSVDVGLTYPKVTLAQVDSLPVGRRVFVEGIALTNILSFGPRELHIRSGSDAVRITSIIRVPLNPGDSVRVLARRATEARQPVLTEGIVIPIRSAVGDPEPIELTTRAASTAQQGAAAAELARIRNADLVAARNEASDVVLTVDDGTGQLEILLRSFLGADASFFKPDSVRVLRATGLLVPYLTEGGEARWRLATRSTLDLTLEAEPKKSVASVVYVRPSVVAAPQQPR